MRYSEELDGCAMMDPDKTRIFAKALGAAAELAEDRGQIHELQSNSDKDIT